MNICRYAVWAWDDSSLYKYYGEPNLVPAEFPLRYVANRVSL